MSACDLERVEALALGGLSQDEAAAEATHISRCLVCARELAALRAERSVFVARVRAEPAEPQFEAVLLASRAPRAVWARRGMSKWLVAGMGAVAALVVGAVSKPAVVDGGGGACFPSDDGAVASAELTQASEESRFSECLLASPAPSSHCF